MIHLFHFELSGTFPIVKINCLQLLVTLLIIKIAYVELNQKSSNFSDLTCLFNNSLFLVTSKDSLINRLNLSNS